MKLISTIKLSALFVLLACFTSSVNASTFFAPGDSCGTAIVITDGTHTIDTIVGGGAVFADATASKWYSYTAAADGLLNINSCLGGQDTRVGVLNSCVILQENVVGTNDDACLYDAMIPDQPYASDLNFLVQQDSTYLITWDDRWSASGFDWSITLGDLPVVNVTVTVDMNAEDMDMGGHIAGNFNGWNSEPMTDNGNGTYTFTITDVTATDSIEYKFQNGLNNIWEGFASGESCTVTTPDGAFTNRLLVVPAESGALDIVCFNSCEACPQVDPTCDQPLFFVQDDMEAYADGDVNGAAPHWGSWAAGATSAVINEEQAASGTKSAKIDGSIATQDALYLLNNATTGHYWVSWKMFVPAGNNAYFNLQHEATPGTSFGTEVQLIDNVGTVNIFDAAGTDTRTFDFPSDEWFDVLLLFDIDNDEARIVVGDQTIEATTEAAWTFSNGISGGAPAVSSGLAAINFFPIDASYVYYIDDLAFAALPAAGDGQYCYTATAIEPGVHTVDTLECFGAAAWINDSGFAGKWYTYSPTTDGFITLGSCGGGADTRGWIFDGECHDLRTQGINDDRCDLGDGNEWASYREAAVVAGNTYYILWDDIWGTDGFDFELTFSSDDLAVGEFCQSAVAVNANEDIFAENFGEASVAGPVIGNYVSSTTPYAGSAWYTFTPTESGTADLTSCDATTDTRVWVYTGNCSAMDSLNLIASADQGCAAGNGSFIGGWEVEAGVTYYIEWDDEANGDPFIWRINIAEPVDVTFNVNMTDEDPNNGGFIAGEMNGWAGEAMTDDGDGTYSITFALIPGDTVEYKFQNGLDGWEDNFASGGMDDCGLNNNRFVVVGEAATEIDLVCFNSCADCIVNTEDLAFSNAISIQPNPATDATNITFDFDEAYDLKIELINSLGQRIIFDELNGTQTATHPLNLRNLASGMYFIHITNGEASMTEKLIVD